MKSDRTFAKSLARRLAAPRRPEARDLVAAVADIAGSTLAPALVAYLEVVGRHAPRRYGLVGFRDAYRALSSARLFVPAPAFDDDDAPPRRGPPVEDVVAALTGTLSLGRDGSGHAYLVELDPARTTIFHYDSSVGELAFFADSLAAFVELRELQERWDAFEKKSGISFDDIEDGDVAPRSLPIDPLRKAMRALDGRVHLPRSSAVSSDFGEILPTVTGFRPRAETQSPVVTRWRRSRWLVRALQGLPFARPPNVGTQKLAGFGRDGLAAGAPAADRVYALLHLFAAARDEELARACASAKGDPSATVRAAATLLGRPKPDDRRALDRLRAAR